MFQILAPLSRPREGESKPHTKQTSALPQFRANRQPKAPFSGLFPAAKEQPWRPIAGYRDQEKPQFADNSRAQDPRTIFLEDLSALNPKPGFGEERDLSPNSIYHQTQCDALRQTARVTKTARVRESRLKGSERLRAIILRPAPVAQNSQFVVAPPER
jgi:hypothetical protein